MLCFVDSPSPLRIVTTPVVNLTINNLNLTMKCLPNEKGLHYIWKKKNDQLPSSALGVSSSQLTIVNLKPEDSGYYQCVASNNTGTISSNYFMLHIKGNFNWL